MKFVEIKTNGDKRIVEVGDSEHDSYNVIRTAVDGLVECVRLYPLNADMWINDNGKALQLDQNPMGTALWVDMYGNTDVISGNIIITGGADEEGTTIGLSDDQVDYFMSYDREIIVGRMHDRVLFMLSLGKATSKF
jgi:hypothetical protein